MKIQFYKAKSGSGGEEIFAPTSARLSRELYKFISHINSVEIHLSDVNGKIAGVNDKRCMILVEVHDLQPISITAQAGSYEKAVNEAILQLKMSFYAKYGRLRVY